jgi:UPF0271 protein
MPSIEFINAGILTTLQDRGRYGVQHMGISVSGAIDKRLMHYVNNELGNTPDHPVLEFALQGPDLRICDNVLLCCAGDFNFQIKKQNGQTINGIQNKLYLLENNDILLTGTCKEHVYGYIGFAHEFLVNPVFESYSIDTRTNIGPNFGKKFSDNDIIGLSRLQEVNIKPSVVFPNLTTPDVIRVTKGPQWNNFINREDFFNNAFSVTTRRNRVGMYLKGPAIKNNMKHDMMSEGIVKGAIQITPNGETIVLLSDHGTTGGYPKIAVVCDEDYEKLAQMPAGQQFNFAME